MSVCVFRNENEGLDHSSLLFEDDNLYVRLQELVSFNYYCIFNT